MRTLYVNGDVYSTSARDATALLVDGAEVAWIGDDIAARALRVDVTVDLDGALVTPAFVDSHVHTTDTGLALSGFSMAGADSPAALLRRIDAAARAGRGRPILGGGWDDSQWSGGTPVRGELDRAGYGGVVYLARVDGHSALVSSALLAAVPGVAELPGYRADGYVTGPAHEALRQAAYAALTPVQVIEAQRAARNRAAELGVAAMHEMAGPEVSGADDLAGLLKLARSEPGPEIFGYWGELFGIPAALELGAVGAGGDVFCDGSLGSHTAALEHPYTDEPNRNAAVRIEVDDLVEHIRAAAAAGLQAGFHAIGDAAVNRLLNALDVVAERHGPAVAAGHRIEHAAMAGDPTRLARSGLTASMQPAFDATWGGAEGMYAVRVGPERAARMHRFADLAAAGVPLALGSDAPVTPLDPWGAVRAAAYPRDPAAGISPRAAFLAHTRGGWRAARADGDGSGTLAPGTPATLAVWRTGELAVDAADERVARWSTDPRAAVPGLPDLRPGTELPQCLRTVLRGEVIFDRGLS